MFTVLCVVWRCQFPFVSGTALFTQDKRASPGGGLITQSTRAAANRRCSSVLCMEKIPAVAAAFHEGKKP
ncbi:hypothetical protein FKL19_19585 [Raoultella ornithinolytica]|nr:hypothetical protein [Raoultella ornithinolytica]